MAPQYAPRRRSQNSYAFWAQFLAVSIVFFPLSLSRVDFRSAFGRGLSISAYKASPAYAAFEDIREDYKPENEMYLARTELLSPGSKVSLPKQTIRPLQRQVVLHGLTVHAPDPTEASPQLVATQPVPRRQYVGAQDMADLAPEERQLAKSTEGNSFAANSSAGLQLVSLGTDKNQALLLNGQIEMTGGLAFVGAENEILVKRVVNGKVLEKGHIWITEGKFEIQVGQATGYLVAELAKRNGEVLGRGEFNLLDLRALRNQGPRINDLRIALRPTQETASLRTVSAYPAMGGLPNALNDSLMEIQAHNDPQPVNDEGYFSDPSLNKGSTFVARASAKKHWPTLVVGRAGSGQEVRLFPSSLLQALINISGSNGTERAEARHRAIVWGQVMRDGHPVVGAKVEMAGPYRPIYLNDAFLPDPNLDGTGTNGIFVFLNVLPGIQAARVSVSEKLYPAQIFTTEEKHVSYVELNLRDKVTSQLQIADMLDSEKALSARVRLVGTENVLSPASGGYIQYSVAANPFMLEADAGTDYMLARTTLTGNPETIQIPMVRRDWLQTLFQSEYIPAQLNRGIVMGLVGEQNFEVEMTGYKPGEPITIIYFDAQGKPLPSAKSGVAGGGFVILNAPSDLQTVYVHLSQSHTTFSQVLVAEPDFVHVMRL